MLKFSFFALLIVLGVLGSPRSAKAQIYGTECLPGSGIAPWSDAHENGGHFIERNVCADATGNPVPPRPVTPKPAAIAPRCPDCAVVPGSGEAEEAAFREPFSTNGEPATGIIVSTLPGADLGAQLNACLSQLPSAGGSCIVAAVAGQSSLQLSTPVNVGIAATIWSCNVAILQTATVVISGNNAAWKGCPGLSTVMTKGANIDQFRMTAMYNTVSGLTLDGNKAGGFTGNGVTVDNTSLGQYFSTVSGNTIQGEAGSDVETIGTLVSHIYGNDLESFGQHAYFSSGGFDTVAWNIMRDDGTATGTTVEADRCTLNLSDNWLVSNQSGFGAIHFTACNSGTIKSNNIQGRRAVAVSADRNEQILGNYVEMFDNFPAIVSEFSSLVAGNNVTARDSDAIQISGQARAVDNAVGISSTGGHCAINIIGESIGAYVGNNSLILSSSGADDYGVCMTIDASTTHMLGNTVADNLVDGFSAGDAAVFFNNLAALPTNANTNTFRNNSCIHMATCVVRNDPANNQNYYENAHGHPTTAVFAPGGSNADVIYQRNEGLNFAQISALTAGSGSEIICVDCTRSSPTSGGGTGAVVIRENGQWNGM